MSVWSTIGKFVGGAASAVGSAMQQVPGLNVLGSGLSSIGGTIGGAAADYEQAKQNEAQRQLTWDLQKDSQKFNSHEAIQSYLRNEQANEKARQYNSAEAEKARQFELGMWKRTNEYNSPANQLRLLQEAGYNPNIFSPSVSEAGNVSGSPVASSSPLGSSSASSGIASSPIMPNPAMVGAQVRLLDAQTQAVQDDNLRKQQLQPFEIKTSEGNITLQGQQKELNELTKKQMGAEYDSTMQSIKESQERVMASEEYRNLLGLQEKDLEIRLEQLRDRLTQELENSRLSAKFTKAQISGIASQIMLNTKLGVKAQSDANLADKQGAYIANLGFLDGVKVDAIKSHGYEAFCDLVWDSEKGKYDVQVKANKKAARLLDRRNDNTNISSWWNDYLDFIEMTGEAYGQIFKIAVPIK